MFPLLQESLPSQSYDYIVDQQPIAAKLFRQFCAKHKGRHIYDVCTILSPLLRVSCFKAGKLDSQTFIHPVCGFSMMEQVRLCAVWPMENWLGSSLNQIQGWIIVQESYSRALERGYLLSVWTSYVYAP